jgi:hypothetical protein
MEKVRIADAQRAAREAEQRRLAEQQAADAAAGVGMSALGDSGMPAEGLPQPQFTNPAVAGPVPHGPCMWATPATPSGPPLPAASDTRPIDQAAGAPEATPERAAAPVVESTDVPRPPADRIPSAAAPAPAVSLPQTTPAVPEAAIPSAPPATPAAEPRLAPITITTPARPTPE